MDNKVELKCIKTVSGSTIAEMEDTWRELQQAIRNGEVLGFCFVASFTGREQMLGHYITPDANLNALVTGLERMKLKVITRFDD